VTELQRLADFVTGAQFERLSKEAVEQLKIHVFELTNLLGQVSPLRQPFEQVSARAQGAEA
jgi:hypothetical protein